MSKIKRADDDNDSSIGFILGVVVVVALPYLLISNLPSKLVALVKHHGHHSSTAKASE